MAYASKIRLLLASGQSLRLLGLVSALHESADLQPDLQIVAECATGRDVLDMLEYHWRQQRPDMLIVDGDLPDMPLSDLLREMEILKSDTRRGAGICHLRTLVMLEEEAPADVMTLLAGGVHGLCNHTISPQTLAEAVVHVYQGGLWFDGGAAAYVQQALAAPLAFAGDRRPTCPGLALTVREREVLALMVEGLNNRRIAERLCLSIHTVKAEVSHILRKMSATDRVEAVVKAIRGEIVPEIHASAV